MAEATKEEHDHVGAEETDHAMLLKVENLGLDAGAWKAAAVRRMLINRVGHRASACVPSKSSNPERRPWRQFYP